MNCNSLKSFFRLWFYDVSRGYSLLMSVMPWLVAFLYCLKQGGNILYGMLALIGIVAAHLGTNVFDDFVDHLTGVPKQKCKTAYIDNGQTTVNKIFFVALLYFSIAALIGLFFTYQFGLPIIYLALSGGIICLLYPKLNFYCLGELALGLAFGPLLFLGVSYVMLEMFDLGCMLVSIPSSIVIVGLLWTHALMDFNFDKQSGKKTFCTVLGSEKKALLGLFILLCIAYIFVTILVYLRFLSLYSLLVFLTLPILCKLHKGLNEYILSDKKDFMKNFVLSRNLAVIFNLLLSLGILLK